ncbi:hypothetical protein [Chryseolinea lacunae]|uniref:DUF1146 domain-containing protein n=1 Tax=Chryseolinea lacunae TaxID=2801331 RepID=A0ABS1KW41_9BACT|nr:hypothetical protein [Chryseolinea lacunae]MBL0743555.1 hypothetical protein [Chryseolinea lacunae]
MLISTFVKYLIVLLGWAASAWFLVQGVQNKGERSFLKAILIFVGTAAAFVLYSIIEFYVLMHV